jgi:hypothetical protein
VVLQIKPGGQFLSVNNPSTSHDLSNVDVTSHLSGYLFPVNVDLKPIGVLYLFESNIAGQKKPGLHWLAFVGLIKKFPGVTTSSFLSMFKILTSPNLGHDQPPLPKIIKLVYIDYDI